MEPQGGRGWLPRAGGEPDPPGDHERVAAEGDERARPCDVPQDHRRTTRSHAGVVRTAPSTETMAASAVEPIRSGRSESTFASTSAATGSSLTTVACVVGPGRSGLGVDQVVRLAAVAVLPPAAAVARRRNALPGPHEDMGGHGQAGRVTPAQVDRPAAPRRRRCGRHGRRPDLRRRRPSLPDRRSARRAARPLFRPSSSSRSRRGRAGCPAGCGRCACRRSISIRPSSRRGAGLEAANASVSSRLLRYPQAIRAPPTKGWNTPPVRSAQLVHASSIASVSAETATGAPPAAFMRLTSLSRRNRDQRASSCSTAAATVAATPSETPPLWWTLQVVPVAFHSQAAVVVAVRVLITGPGLCGWSGPGPGRRPPGPGPTQPARPTRRTCCRRPPGCSSSRRLRPAEPS